MGNINELVREHVILQKFLLRMLSDQGKELKMIKSKYAEKKQKFKILIKMLKIRDVRTLDNRPCNKAYALCERRFKHPNAFAKEKNKN